MANNSRFPQAPIESAKCGWNSYCFLLAGVLLLLSGATLRATAQNPQPPNGSTPQQNPGPGRAWTTGAQDAIPVVLPAAPDANAANTERKKQIADDSARLLKLATDLKAEVDKTNKDTLSLSVIHKADEIEKLAHNVKEKMKLTVGGS